MKFDLLPHLYVLRQMVIRIFTVYLLVFFCCYYFKQSIIEYITYPLCALLNDNVIIYTNLTEAFLVYIKVPALTGVIISMPYIAYQIFLFARSGLTSKERAIFRIICFFIPILSWLGAIFVIYIIMPCAWSFFLSYQGEINKINFVFRAKIGEYVSLTISLIFAFIIAFQVPIVTLLAHIFKICSISDLRRYRRYVILVSFIVAAVITPPDILSQIFLALTMILLYELGILMVKLCKTK